MRPINDVERAALSPSRGMIELGRSVASTACAECHGSDGLSTAPGIPHLAGQRIVYLYRILQAYQARERTNDSMNHAVGFLNDEALLAVSAYFANLPPARPAASAAEVAETESIPDDPFFEIKGAMKKCVKCHGETGNSDASGMPNLTAQDPEYFVSAMQAYAEGDRNHKLMKKLVAALDESVIAQMGVFYAVQVPQSTQTKGDGDAKAGGHGAEACAGCHGADGNASGADMPTLAGQDARYFIKAMEAYKDGERQHQQMFGAVEALSEVEISDLAAFYATQEPVRRNVRVPFTSAEWMARCERCHGLDGNSSDPRFPMLAGQDAEYLKKALQAYTERGNGSAAMHAMADPLSTADVDRIVAHYAAQEPKSVMYMQLPCEEQSED
jgi:cytochrome c553